jgi:hypothetical protein
MPVCSESLIFLHATKRKERQSWGCKGALFFGKIFLVNNPKKNLEKYKTCRFAFNSLLSSISNTVVTVCDMWQH